MERHCEDHVTSNQGYQEVVRDEQENCIVNMQLDKVSTSVDFRKHFRGPRGGKAESIQTRQLGLVS